MGATFSRIKTWIAEVLTAADLNAEFNNILNNLDPAGIDDESATAIAMRAVADPYPGGAESLATSMQGEIQRLRYLIKQMTGEAQWYIDPDSDIATLAAKSVATDAIWDAPGDLVYGTGANTAAKLPLGLAALPVINLSPVVNAAANKLDVFSKSGGAAPDATNYITVSIPDGTGVVSRQRAGVVASGTGQIVLADAANYWSKGNLAAEIKTAYLYAIWSAADAGIVWALGGYSGFTRVPASVTATDDDFFLLEASSTYTKVITDYCVCVAKIRYEYDTGDAPDHTIQATVLDAPQVVWNPPCVYCRSTNPADYAFANNPATGVTAMTGYTLTIDPPVTGKYRITTNFNVEIYGDVATQILQTILFDLYDGSTVLESLRFGGQHAALAGQRVYLKETVTLIAEVNIVASAGTVFVARRNVTQATGITVTENVDIDGGIFTVEYIGG